MIDGRSFIVGLLQSGGKAFYFTFLVALAFLWAWCNLSWGYNPKTHSTIILKAIDLLRSDGRSEMADFFYRYRTHLLKGVQQAETAGGYFTIADREIYRNSFSHFYNPTTGKGFTVSTEDLENLMTITEFLPFDRWELNTLKGPHPAATDMADWAYAEAVDAMRRGRAEEAMTHLGWALHYVSDLTVPHHTNDEGFQKPDSYHFEYKDACDALLSRIPHATSGGIYRDDWRPGEFVMAADDSARMLIDQARDRATFKRVAGQMMPLSERLSAGLMARFYRRWRDEDFTVFVLTISRVKEAGGSSPARDVDSTDGASFYARVVVGMYDYYYETEAIGGSSDIRPNALATYNWVFAKWMNGRKKWYMMRIEIRSGDGAVGDRLYDISPFGGGDNRGFDFAYNLRRGKAIPLLGAREGNGILIEESGNQTSVRIRGDAKDASAEIWFSVERLPAPLHD